MELKKVVTESLTEAILEVFTNVLNAVPSIKEKHYQLPAGRSVFACIGLAGKMDGSLVLLLSDDVACKIVSKMFSMEFSQVTPEVLDGSGEVSNILAGVLKSRIVHYGDYSFEISLPTVVREDSTYSVYEKENSDVIELEVSAGGLSFGIKYFYALGDGSKKEAGIRKETDYSDSLKNLIDGNNNQNTG